MKVDDHTSLGDHQHVRNFQLQNCSEERLTLNVAFAGQKDVKYVVDGIFDI